MSFLLLFVSEKWRILQRLQAKQSEQGSKEESTQIYYRSKGHKVLKENVPPELTQPFDSERNQNGIKSTSNYSKKISFPNQKETGEIFIHDNKRVKFKKTHSDVSLDYDDSFHCKDSQDYEDKEQLLSLSDASGSSDKSFAPHINGRIRESVHHRSDKPTVLNERQASITKRSRLLQSYDYSKNIEKSSHDSVGNNKKKGKEIDDSDSFRTNDSLGSISETTATDERKDADHDSENKRLNFDIESHKSPESYRQRPIFENDTDFHVANYDKKDVRFLKRKETDLSDVRIYDVRLKKVRVSPRTENTHDQPIQAIQGGHFDDLSYKNNTRTPSLLSKINLNEGDEGSHKSPFISYLQNKNKHQGTDSVHNARKLSPDFRTTKLNHTGKVLIQLEERDQNDNKLGSDLQSESEYFRLRKRTHEKTFQDVCSQTLFAQQTEKEKLDEIDIVSKTFNLEKFEDFVTQCVRFQQKVSSHMEEIHRINEELSKLSNSIPLQKMLIKYRAVELSLLKECRFCNEPLKINQSEGNDQIGISSCIERDYRNHATYIERLNLIDPRPTSMKHRVDGSDELSIRGIVSPVPQVSTIPNTVVEDTSIEASLFANRRNLSSSFDKTATSQIYISRELPTDVSGDGNITPLINNKTRGRILDRDFQTNLTYAKEIKLKIFNKPTGSLNRSLSPFLFSLIPQLSIFKGLPCSFWYS